MPPPADDPSLWRTLDAAANRAREGLRVLEDYTRFTLGDGHLTRVLKDLRHGLAQRMRSFGDAPLRHRDTPGDVGTTIHTTAEGERQTDFDLLAANIRRVQEALRTLEEFSKRIDPAAAEFFGQSRYRCYTLEQALTTTARSRDRLADVSVCLLVSESHCRGGLERTVRGALDAGCRMIQLREKSLADRDLLARAGLLRRWTREAGALLIINDRADIAALVDADGVHVGQEDLPPPEARRIVGPRRLVGVSTHSIEQARSGVLSGADYLGVGPVFPSRTKSFHEFVGLSLIRTAANEISLPWIAIGGIDAERARDIAAAGGRRIAVGAALCGAEDPAAAMRNLLVAIGDQSAP